MRRWCRRNGVSKREIGIGIADSIAEPQPILRAIGNKATFFNDLGAQFRFWKFMLKDFAPVDDLLNTTCELLMLGLTNIQSVEKAFTWNTQVPLQHIALHPRLTIALWQIANYYVLQSVDNWLFKLRKKLFKKPTSIRSDVAKYQSTRNAKV